MKDQKGVGHEYYLPRVLGGSVYLIFWQGPEFRGFDRSSNSPLLQFIPTRQDNGNGYGTLFDFVHTLL